MPLPQLPPPDAAVLHVHSHAAGQFGPLSRRELHAKLEAGEIPGQSHLWMDGMAGWELLEEHRGTLFADLVAPVEVAAAAPAPEAAPAASASAPAPEPELAAEAATPSSPAPEPAAAPDPAPAPASEPAAPASDPTDDEQDRRFGDLVRQSWAYLGEHRFAAHIDEVFVGALITSTLDTGYSLIDLTSDGTHHYLRFENLSDRTRIIARLTHLTPSLAVSKVIGQRMSAIFGYGERIANMGKIWSALQAEMKSSYIQDAEPGTITVDGDMASGYVYCQVDLYLDIERYVSQAYAVDHALLSSHVGAVTHALRKYLRGRFA